MKVYYVFSLESPQRGDSNEYTYYSIFQYKKENIPKLPQICNYGICSKGLKNKFETAVVNEPLVFEPSKFYCILIHHLYFIYFCRIMSMGYSSMDKPQKCHSTRPRICAAINLKCLSLRIL